MYEPWDRVAPASPRTTAPHVALSGGGKTPTVPVLSHAGTKPFSSTLLDRGALKSAGGAIQLNPFGGQVAKLNLHFPGIHLPPGAASGGSGAAAGAPGAPGAGAPASGAPGAPGAPSATTAPQIPYYPPADAGATGQWQQQYVAQNVSTPVNVVSQPQISVAYNPPQASQDLGPVVSPDVAAGMMAYGQSKCLWWLVGGAALAYLMRKG